MTTAHVSAFPVLADAVFRPRTVAAGRPLAASSGAAASAPAALRLAAPGVAAASAPAALRLVAPGVAAASAPAAPRPAVPAAVRSWAREAVLVLGAFVFLTVMAQVVVPLPFTPVPLTLSTFAVILTGAALGPWRGLATMALYLAVGAAGGPVFAGWESGWAMASFGYVLGYLPAAALIGWAASRGSDRRVWSMALGALLSSAAIYAVGVGWLMGWLGVDLAAGLQLGMLPFLIGDAIKIGIAALLLPGAWKLVERIRG